MRRTSRGDVIYHPYFDIREKLGEPLWHDEHGVPRYVPFHPEHVGIYYRWIALLEIRCQACDAPFLVACAFDQMQVFKNAGHTVTDLADIDRALPSENDPGWFGYGDAPWHGDHQCAGTTMTTSVYRIVEFWTHDGGPHKLEWRRRPELEFAYPEGA